MSEEIRHKIEMFTDGACRGNPGPGGWGVLLRHDKRDLELYGGEPNTTNNRMELMAAIQGFESLKKPCLVYVSTDSQYLLNGITQWLPGWIRKGWKTAAKTPVKNQDLWQRLVAAMAPHQVEWRWVKGHSGHPGNEHADQLANRGVDDVLGKTRSDA